MTKTPYDSFVLAAVVNECRGMERGRLQRITQPGPLDIVLEVHWQKRDFALLLSADPVNPRAYLVSQRHKAPQQPPAFCMALRKTLEGSFVRSIRQVRFDRVLEIEFATHDGAGYRLVVELMGRHSNIILVSASGAILNAIKHISSKQSRLREVLPHRPYLPPPTSGRPDPLEVSPTLFRHLLSGAAEAPAAWLSKTFEGISPFLAQEIWLRADERQERLEEAFFDWQELVKEARFSPTLVRGPENFPIGAYPMRLLQAPAERQFERDLLSPSLEYYFNDAIPRAVAAQARASLEGTLRKALKAREDALAQIGQAIEQGRQANRLQLMGDLILAFGQNLPDGATVLQAPDYTQPEQPMIEISLDPELTPLENAERYYKKARRGKEAADERIAHQARLTRERDELAGLLVRLEEAGGHLKTVEALRGEAVEKGWLIQQGGSAKERSEENPFGGHRIRTVSAEGGWQILYGESATANDFLTQRVAKPNDWWLHVRAAVSAHVVIRTGNNPNAVPKRVLEQAAKIAVQNSPSKHSQLVPVDYTLKKYVRKPKGSAPGAVLYTHEKTLHISG